VLHPAFLLAAAITDEGALELPAVEAGAAFPLGRLQVLPDAQGTFVQRMVPVTGHPGDWQPLDMAVFARFLTHALGPVTPSLFAVRGVGLGGQPRGRLARADAASEAARRRLLQRAFLVHLAAYEGRLV